MSNKTEACGCSGNPKFDGVDPSYKRILWTVIFINAAMFFAVCRKCRGFCRKAMRHKISSK